MQLAHWLLRDVEPGAGRPASLQLRALERIAPR
jgi:hypothetical protein